jgi:hypothetical protein
MTEQLHNVASGEVYGGLVQAGYISGNLNIHLPPSPPSSTHTVTGAANSPWYFIIGWNMGNRLSLLPLDKEGRTARDELVEALAAIGLAWEEFAPVLTTGHQLVDPPPPDPHGKNLAIRAYTGALDDLQRRVEQQANRDELAWFMLGRLVVEIRTYRVLDHQFAANPDGSEPRDLSHSVYAAQIMLRGVAETVKLPSAVEALLDRFLDTLARDATLLELFDRSEELKHACQAMLRLSRPSD